MHDASVPGQGFNLSRWAIRHRHLTRFFFVLTVIAGLFSLHGLGQKEDPEFTFRIMVVQAVWPGASLEEMQDQVVDKIERKLQETPGLDYLHSYTRAGSAVVMVYIRGDVFGRDITDAFYQVRKKISDISSTFPSGVLGPYFNDEFGDTYVELYALTGPGYSYPELKEYAKRARDVSLRVNGVEKAQIIGDQDQKIFVDVSSKTLAERGINAQSIADALAQQNAMDPAGRVETGVRSVRIAVDGMLHRVEEIRELRIRAGAEVIRLGDVATVTSGLVDPPDRLIRFDGKDAVLLGVVMAKGHNVTVLGKELGREMKTLEASLPVGVQLANVSDQPQIVSLAIDDFAEALIEALVIVLAVSFLSIGLRAGLVVAVTIPTVICGTFAVMLLMGIDLQRVSLGALIIALGLLVDDAMIAVEMMERKLEEGLDKISAASFAYTSTAFPMLTGTLVTTAGFIPVGFAASTAGEYVNSLFWVVGTALCISWIAAVYFTPWVGYMLLRVRPHVGTLHDPYQTRFYRGLRATIGWSVDHRAVVLAVTLVAFVAGVAGFKYVPKSFFPESTRLELLVDLWFPEGTGIAEVDSRTREIEKYVLADPDPAYVATFVGEGAPRFYMPLDQQLGNPNFAELLVVAKDLPARERLVAKIRTHLGANYPMIRSKVDRLVMGPPTGWAVQLRVVGPERAEVRRLADLVGDAFRAEPAISTVHDDWLEPVPALRLVVDQDRARALGVTSQVIRRTLQAALSGSPIGEFRDGDETVAIVLRESEGGRNLLTAVADTYVPTATGRSVPMSQVATVVPVLEPGIEWRRNRLPSITVRGLLPDGMPSNDVTERIYRNLAPLRASLAPGYSIELQGAVEESAKSQESINAKVPYMVIAMMVLLMLQLQHFGKTMLVFMTAPLGLIGASVALLLTDSAFGFVAILGVIALAGIIMRNSVILIDQISQDLDAGHHPWDATIESAVRRFRPIMLTATAAVLALIPIARSSFWGPMAYAMMGGILAATVLTILVVPAAYALFFRVHRRPPETGAERIEHGTSVEEALDGETRGA
jgi:multidrug efflux pump subunit AcrB